VPDVSVLSAERPFPGLRPFGSADSAFFFGRKAQFYALYRLLNLSRFVAVIGSSGSGKSSLVRAGLLPLLEQEADQHGGRQWVWEELRPGDMPLQSLTRALIRLGEKSAHDDDPAIAEMRAERIAYHLRGSSHGVANAIGEMEQLEDRPIILLIDQFEELFRFADSASRPGQSLKDEARQRDEAAHFVQLILEASRSGSARVHVLLTMRSDFIGDCARFHGLPEAVSATQFLVPALTRDQREEVVRGPLQRARATIDPALVEQLLNDSGDDFDQLPVLQHCLLRLWEQSAAAQAGQPALETGRHLSLDGYERIKGISGALSQHADEILTKDLSGHELVVARVFRALSELDRDGRATRRALPFERIRAETGASEEELRAVLDRFRDDDCSFLTPSLSAMRALADRTRIDVGHEALLRRWERISGIPGATGERSDLRPIGWLREEHRDGQRYQALLGLASGEESEGSLLSSEQVERYWRWWNEQSRTPEWTERYGGGYAQVTELLEVSRRFHEEQRLQREAEERSKLTARRTRIAASILGALLFIALGGVYLIYDQYQLAKSQEEVARRTARSALESLKDVLGSVSEGLSYGAVSVEGARDLLNSVERTIATVPDSDAEVRALKANLLLGVSDVMRTLGENETALDRASAAGAMADQLVLEAPDRDDFQHLIYASGFRTGDAILSLSLKKESREKAAPYYLRALGAAEKLEAADPGRGDRLYDLAFINNKVGELRQIDQDLPGALEQFRKALEVARKAAAADASNVAWQAIVPSTLIKIANALAYGKPRDYEGGLAQFAAALVMQEELLQRFPTSTVVRSNLATAYRGNADILVLRWQPNDFDQAVGQYSAAIDLMLPLSDRDPSNAAWLIALAPNYRSLGKAYVKAGDEAANADRDEVALAHYRSALVQYEKDRDVRERLVKKDPTNENWKRYLGTTIKNIEELKAAHPELVTEQSQGAVEP
jgi:tetratricopeptide (TPR) repeat protein